MIGFSCVLPALVDGYLVPRLDRAESGWLHNEQQTIIHQLRVLHKLSHRAT